jgi:hypothetical protein
MEESDLVPNALRLAWYPPDTLSIGGFLVPGHHKYPERHIIGKRRPHLRERAEDHAYHSIGDPQGTGRTEEKESINVPTSLQRRGNHIAITARKIREVDSMGTSTIFLSPTKSTMGVVGGVFSGPVLRPITFAERKNERKRKREKKKKRKKKNCFFFFFTFPPRQTREGEYLGVGCSIATVASFVGASAGVVSVQTLHG